MHIELVPMDAAAIGRFLDRSLTTYVAELQAHGVAAAEAERSARREQEEAFPDGRPAEDHLVFDVVVDGDVAGHLWLGPGPQGDRDHWWVWDIEVAEARRGRGVGRTVMQLAEREARSRGGREIGLSVFADNAAARHLYLSLGYQEVSLRLRKPV